jgi:hypothetical protein
MCCLQMHSSGPMKLTQTQSERAQTARLAWLLNCSWHAICSKDVSLGAEACALS